MTTALALPTRHDEDFRYTDLAALEAAWPVTREEIAVAAGESAHLALVMGEGAGARHLVITLADDATFDLRVLNAAGRFGRVAVDVRLGRGAHFEMGAAQLGGAAETVEIVTEVTHAEPDATSNQIIRSVLAGKAVGTYLGRVAVSRGANGTDAAQSVRAMLLDRTATANARPELEIFADDVKCAHGCAVGELDAMGLFYLQSRGLAPADAKRLMLQAFVAEAFVGAPDEAALNDAALAALEALL
jgi:Fe-S cluster assembly protein SufD